jgi:TolB-like protein/class 3 adenylate cyclase
MGTKPLERKLAAILCADVAGYSRLTGEDEEGTHRALSAHLDTFTTAIERHNGNVLHYAGDAVLAEFATVSDALICAVAVQQNLMECNEDLAEDRKVLFRIGVNLGEVIADRSEIYGDGVNIAARLEGLAEPGGICISESVHAAMGNKLPLEYEFIGEQEVKNITKPVRAYSVEVNADTVLPGPSPRPTSHRPTRQVLVTTFAAAVLIIAISVLAWLQPWQTAEEPASTETAALPLPDKPSIVVLPFANYYDDGEQDYFVDGFTNAITTHLSKFPQLFVISSTTAFTYKGKSIRVTNIGHDLGVKYVLEGSVQRGANTLSVHAQLIEAETDRHVWAEQYDVPPEKVFSVQADLVSEIVGTLRSTLRDEAIAAVSKRPAANLQGYDLYLKAFAVSKKFSKKSRHEAIELLGQVIEIDPEFLAAHYRISTLYLSLWRFNMADDVEEALRLARLHARKAMEIDQSDYRGHYLIGQLSLFADHDHDLALAEFQRALADNPNEANILYYMGFLQSLMGRGKEAIAWNEKAKRVNPRYPGWYNFNAALAHFLVQDYEKAILLAKSGIAAYPKALAPRRILITTLVEMGRLDEAKQEATEYLEIRPSFRLSTFRNTPFKHQADQDRYFGALRKAGIPD